MSQTERIFFIDRALREQGGIAVAAVASRFLGKLAIRRRKIIVRLAAKVFSTLDVIVEVKAHKTIVSIA